MMRTLLTGTVLCMSFFAHAQINITKPDLAQPGDTLFYGSDTTNVTVDMAATAGANQAWDFSAATKDFMSQAWFLSPESSPVSAPAGITHVFIDGDISNTTFMNATDTALYNIQPNPAYSFVGGEPFLGVRSLGFPLHYQDVSRDSIMSVSTVPGSAIFLGTLADSVRVSIKVTINSNCDAWGSLKTSKETYSSTLRVKNTIVTTFKLEGKKNILPVWFDIPVSALPIPVPARQTEITYAWLGTGCKYFLAEANMVTDSETERDVLRWQVARPVNSGLFNAAKNTVHINAYPNPASAQINLSFYLDARSDMKVDLFDATGRLAKTIHQSCSAGNNLLEVNTSDLSQGLYTAFISGNGKSASVNVSVVK